MNMSKNVLVSVAAHSSMASHMGKALLVRHEAGTTLLYECNLRTALHCLYRTFSAPCYAFQGHSASAINLTTLLVEGASKHRHAHVAKLVQTLMSSLPNAASRTGTTQVQHGVMQSGQRAGLTHDLATLMPQ